ncbi:MAG: dihydrodipicolinate synthase family protein [bacterium]
MAEKKLYGIIAPLITPFTKDGELDEALVEKEIKFLLKSGVHGISPGGSTGEGAAVTDEELVRMIKLIRSIDRDIPIVAGIIRNSTRAAVAGALAAKAAGADALMVTPVSYNVLVPDDEGNYSFYEAISKATDLPIVIYNVVPQNTISAPLFSRLLNIENVIGIKQSCGGIMAFYEMKMVNGSRGKIYSATDDMLYSTYELGADGAISAILTVFPEICVEMWNDVQNKNSAHALELQNRMYATWQAIAGNQFPIRIKHALHLLGRNPGYPRSPITHIAEQDQKRIETALRDAGFIQ